LAISRARRFAGARTPLATARFLRRRQATQHTPNGSIRLLPSSIPTTRFGRLGGGDSLSSLTTGSGAVLSSRGYVGEAIRGEGLGE